MKAQQTGVAVQGFALLVKDSSNNYYQLNAEGLNALMMLGEALWTTDILDERESLATVTVALGAPVGTAQTDDIDIPAGEIWYIQRFGLEAPANDATGAITWNMLVSQFPVVAATGVNKGFFNAARVPIPTDTEQVEVESGNIDVLTAPGVLTDRVAGLGKELRLIGPATVTLATITNTAAFTAAYVVNLILYGRKVHKVVG